MTDLVAALRWVRDNIANFGGDPDSVMIYGQSGGGSKVTTLMGMPSAAGLIHRASAQSGGGGNPPSGEQSRELARQVMAELGLGANDIGRPAEDGVGQAERRRQRRRREDQSGDAAREPRPGRPQRARRASGWGPTVDGRIITMRAFFDGRA